MTFVSSSAKNSGDDFMKERIFKDAYRIMVEKKCSLELALALLACRYTSPQFRAKTAELLEHRLVDV